MKHVFLNVAGLILKLLGLLWIPLLQELGKVLGMLKQNHLVVLAVKHKALIYFVVVQEMCNSSAQLFQYLETTHDDRLVLNCHILVGCVNVFLHAAVYETFFHEDVFLLYDKLNYLFKLGKGLVEFSDSEHQFDSGLVINMFICIVKQDFASFGSSSWGDRLLTI